jgi:hypothetical protein
MEFLALALALLAASRFSSRHSRSGWLCAFASSLVLADALAYSLILSALAASAMVAAFLAVALETFPITKRVGLQKRP